MYKPHIFPKKKKNLVYVHGFLLNKCSNHVGNVKHMLNTYSLYYL